MINIIVRRKTEPCNFNIQNYKLPNMPRTLKFDKNSYLIEYEEQCMTQSKFDWKLLPCRLCCVITNNNRMRLRCQSPWSPSVQQWNPILLTDIPFYIIPFFLQLHFSREIYKQVLLIHSIHNQLLDCNKGFFLRRTL